MLIFEAVLIFLVPLLPEMQMGKKRPVRCNQNADISQQWWKKYKKWTWQWQVDWMKIIRWVVHVKKMSDGTEMDYAYHKATLMKDIHSIKWRQLDLIKMILQPVHNQTVWQSQQWYDSNDDKWMWPCNC